MVISHRKNFNRREGKKFFPKFLPLAQYHIKHLHYLIYHFFNTLTTKSRPPDFINLIAELNFLISSISSILVRNPLIFFWKKFLIATRRSFFLWGWSFINFFLKSRFELGPLFFKKKEPFSQGLKNNFIAYVVGF